MRASNVRRKGPAEPLGFLRLPLQILGVVLIGALCVVASWGTYRQFAPFVTLGTIPIFGLSALLPVALLVFGRSVGLRPFDFLVLPIVFIALASSTWALYPSAWGLQAFYYIACTALYLSCRVFIRTVSAVNLLILCAAVGGLVGVALIEPTQSEWSTAELRAAIEGINQNFTAYTLVGTIYLLLIHERIWAERKITHLFAWGLCAVFTFGVYELETRGALVAIALMLAWYVGSRFIGTRHVGPAVAGAFLLSMIFSFGALESLGTLVESLFQRNTGDLSGRLPVWAYARALIFDHLAVGVGAGGFQFLNPMGIGAHNFYLALLLDIGLFGLIFVLVFLGAGLWPAFSARSTPRQRFALGMFACYFIPIAMSGHFELAPFTWVVLALTFTFLRPSPQDPRQAPDPHPEAIQARDA